MRTLWACGAVATLALTIAACSPFGSDAFECDTTEQCGAGGVCELAVHACSFASSDCGPGGRAYGQYSGELAGQCTDDGPIIVDAPPDDPPPATCAAGTRACYGGAIETCKGDGTGYDPAVRVPCALACDQSSGTPTCYQASGIPVNDQLACVDADVKDLQAGDDAKVTFRDDRIDCQGCAGGVTTIPKRGTNPNNWFCLKSLALGANTELDWQTGNVLTLFVVGAATINANLDLDGGNGGTLGQIGGGGPGGGDGGGLSNQDAPGKLGQGPCAGGGGGHSGTTAATSVGGGGGGAGGAGTGGTGGLGGATLAVGGTGGSSPQCDFVTVQPLRGGSGGGGGGDGECGPLGCGAPGGGGGGGIHIAARGELTGSGQFRVRGGRGADAFNGTAGGGGGGAGGNVLVEAKTVSLTGQLDVSGGDGGRTGVRGGGGAQGLAGGNGTTGTGATDAGAGGGGASGRIRVNALSAPNACGNAKPTGACSSDKLRVQGS